MIFKLFNLTKRDGLDVGSWTKITIILRKNLGSNKSYKILAVVVAQLVERSILILKVCGSNPVIGKNLFVIVHLFNVNCVLKRQK